MRTPEQLFKAYEKATRENPLVIARDEAENFSKAMRISYAYEDARMGRQSSNLTLMDKDKLLRDGILSPLDMKTSFHNRHDWADHLKRHDCVEVGNDLNSSTKKNREIKGDFDCRKELAEATHQILG